LSKSFYKTIDRTGEGQYRVLGSRHISQIFHVKDEKEIKAIVDTLWKEHHSATHICYAWRLGWDKSRFRMNDDGEPSGTAGKPIFGQIQSFDLTNILITVIRYYGGTKLGTGGLIDAYKTASKLAIENANVIEKEVMDHFKLHFDYADMPSIMKVLKDFGMEKLDSDFTEKCWIEFLLPMECNSGLENKLEDWTSAKLEHIGRM
jgi:uncharacterized YigZ family protein